MKKRTYNNIEDLGKDLGLSKEQITIAKMKTQLKKKIRSTISKKDLTITEVSVMSGLSRTVVSGIVNGSLQSVSIERLIKLGNALELKINLTVKEAA